MKRHYFILMVISVMLTSCKKSDIEYESKFDKSYETWLAFKTSANNSYRYKVYFGSWTGSSSETELIIKAGKVVGRTYLAKNIDPSTNKVVVYEEWTEDLSSLNTHSNGYLTLTMDEIYQKAKTEWLIKREDAKVSLETKNNGMISACGYVPDNCADDCFNGISITLIEAI